MSGTNIVWKGDVEIDVVKRDSLTMMEYQANKQIDLLKRQAELLMKQVKEIQDRVELAHLVAQAKYNFKPVLMKEYYLYKAEFLGIISAIFNKPSSYRPFEVEKNK